MKNRALAIALAAFSSLLTAGTALAETITAAGATFPAPIYQKWFEEYRKLHPDVQINYQSVGSGAGIRQLTEGTVVFGASDVPMTDEQLAKFTKAKILHFPTVLGAVLPVYNIEGVTAQIKFMGDTLAGIFLETIWKWYNGVVNNDIPRGNMTDNEIIGSRRHGEF